MLRNDSRSVRTSHRSHHVLFRERGFRFEEMNEARSQKIKFLRFRTGKLPPGSRRMIRSLLRSFRIPSPTLLLRAGFEERKLRATACVEGPKKVFAREVHRPIVSIIPIFTASAPSSRAWPLVPCPLRHPPTPQFIHLVFWAIVCSCTPR